MPEPARPPQRRSRARATQPIGTVPIVPAELARRTLLHAQDLLAEPRKAATPAALQQTIERLGFVQVDSISTVERAHHLTLFSRMPAYQPRTLTVLLEARRSVFEHWTHDASIIPTQWYPHWKHRFERARDRLHTANAWWRERLGDDPQRLLDAVRARIEREGPLRSADFEYDRAGQPSGWWGWKPQKAALEHLWRAGELAIAQRVSFHKVYDLTERVFPDLHRAPASAEHDYVHWACASALERLGFATPGELAAFWHAVSPAQAQQWCREMCAQQAIERVLVDSADGSKPRAAYAPADWRRAADRLPAPTERLRLLGPFDPVLRDRKRAQRLFNFDYRFEAFVPQPKRTYGYYVMPIMRGDRLIGRIDPKVFRDRNTLAIRKLWWEPNIRAHARLKNQLSEAAERLAAFAGVQHVELPVA